MAHIEQTKKASRKSGGPQYYLQELTENTQALLRSMERHPVRLWTPYGVIDSGLTAVSSTVGSVGHDRVQSGGRVRSIADQIAFWYGLPKRQIERIEFEDSFDHDSFVIRPSRIKFFGHKQLKTVRPCPNPLTITASQQSPLVREHLKNNSFQAGFLQWARDQISSLVKDHQSSALNVHELDLLRASGALEILGISLGMYHSKGIDCPNAAFRFHLYPHYPCQVEIEERSSGFLSRHHAAHRKQRVVMVCMQHDKPEVLTDYIDVIELESLARMLRQVA